MKTLPFVLISLLALALMTSCKRSIASPPSVVDTTSLYPFHLPEAGVYRYSGYDSLGTLIVQGTLQFRYPDATHIRGSWNLVKVGTPTGIGPQTGNDTLVGNYSTNSFALSLNPALADNNVYVFLTGRVDTITFVGQWAWFTYAGTSNHGKSKAVRDSLY